MYIDPSLVQETEGFVRDCLTDTAFCSYQVNKLNRELQAELRKRFAINEDEALNLLVRIMLSTVFRGHYPVDQETIKFYWNAKKALLDKSHEASVPILDRTFCSFSRTNAYNIATIASGGFGMAFSPVQNLRQDDEFLLQSEMVSRSGVYVLKADIFGRAGASPKLVDGIYLLKDGEKVASVSLAKLFGLGYWVVCPKNSKATMDQISSAFNEVMHFLTRFRDSL